MGAHRNCLTLVTFALLKEKDQREPKEASRLRLPYFVNQETRNSFPRRPNDLIKVTQ